MKRYFLAFISLALAALGVLWLALGPARSKEAWRTSPHLLYDVSEAGLRFRAIGLARERLTLQRAEILGRGFVRDAAGGIFSEVLIVEREADLEPAQLGTVPLPESEPSFDETLVQLKEVSVPAGQPPGPMARIISMHGSALLTYRMAGYGEADRPGVRDVLLDGDRDPTQYQLEDGVYRLLHLRVKRSSSPNYLNLAVFFKSRGEPSCRSCVELATLVRKYTGAHNVEVEIRRDTWFASLWFPLFFRFEPDNEPVVYSDVLNRVIPPKVWQYYRMPHVRCLWNAGGLTCDKYDRCEHIP